MATERHTTIAGDVITYETPSREVAAYLAHVRRLAEDPEQPESAVVEAIYGNDNPVLDQSILASRGVVTPAVQENPVYRVMLDLLELKRLIVGTLDIHRVDAEFTMTVAETAEQLGVHPSAVRQAIGRGALEARKRSSSWRISPKSVEAYEPSRRGPAPPLRIRFGTEGTIVSKVKHAGAWTPIENAASVRDGELRTWERIGLMTGCKASDTWSFYELEQGTEQQELSFGPFFVRGRFKVARTAEGAASARGEWKAFSPS